MAGFWVRGISLEGFEVGTRTFPSWGGVVLVVLRERWRGRKG